VPGTPFATTLAAPPLPSPLTVPHRKKPRGNRVTQLRVTQVELTATRYQAHLPPALAAHPTCADTHKTWCLRRVPSAASCGRGSRPAPHGRRLPRALACRQWDAARTAHRDVRASAAAARLVTTRTKQNAPARPRRRSAPRPRPRLPRSKPCSRSSRQTGPHRAARRRRPAAPHAPCRRPAGQNHAPERAAAPPAVASLGPPRPLAPERVGDAHAADPRRTPRHAPSLGMSEPPAPAHPRSPTPPHLANASLLTALPANLHALERIADAPPTAAAPPAVPSRDRSESRRSEPLAPVAPPTPRAEPHAPDPACPRSSPARRADAGRACNDACTRPVPRAPTMTCVPMICGTQGRSARHVRRRLCRAVAPTHARSRNCRATGRELW
jgi:hypothetical protein